MSYLAIIISEIQIFVVSCTYFLERNRSLSSFNPEYLAWHNPCLDLKHIPYKSAGVKH